MTHKKKRPSKFFGPRDRRHGPHQRSAPHSASTHRVAAPTASGAVFTRFDRSVRRESFVREVSAGGVVFKRVDNDVFFALMRDSYDKWAFPKGHVEGRESLEEAAARETLEELGLEEVRLLDYLGKIDIWFRDRFEKKGTLIHKDIHYFLFETPSDAVLDPDPGEHAYEGRWVRADEVFSASSYPDMLTIVRRALSYVADIAHPS